jgi:hypothetical protein
MCAAAPARAVPLDAPDALRLRARFGHLLLRRAQRGLRTRPEVLLGLR